MKNRNLVIGSLIILLATMFTIACSKSNNNGNTTSSPKVYMKNSVFSNANLQVTTGSTVTWINDDTKAHTVTANNGSFDSGDIMPGSSFNWTFSSTGTFAYYSKGEPSMTGVVVVVAKSSGGGY